MSKNPVKVSEFIKRQIEASDKTQKDIAREVGFAQPNNISMIKDGLTKLPINRVPAFARALSVDPVHLLRITMREYMPETWQVIESMLGESLVTDSEKKLLEIVRKASRNLEIDFEDPKTADAITKAIAAIADKELTPTVKGTRSTQVARSAAHR